MKRGKIYCELILVIFEIDAPYTIFIIYTFSYN